MEEVIDLRPYIKSLIRRWHLIFGVTVAMSLLFFSVSFLLPPKYEATAIVTIIKNDQVTFASLTIFDLDPAFAEQSQADPLARIYLDLATSDELLQLVLDEIDPLLDEDSNIESVDDLREKLRAKVGSDFSLLMLTAEDDSPQLASSIANTWAKMFAPWVNDKFDSQGLQSLAFFEQQLVEAENALSMAEANLVQYQSINHTTTISNTLDFSIETQMNYLGDKQSLISIKQDVENLQNQLMTDSSTNEVSFADQIAAVNLQLSSFSPKSSNVTQLQINTAEPLISSDRQENIDFLNALENTLEVKIDFIDMSLAELEPQILILQEQLEESLSQYRKLVRERNAAEEAYTAILRKVTEERVSAAQQQTDNAILVSESVIPKRPADRGRLMYALAGGAISFMLTVIGIIGFEWWKEFDNDAEA